MRQVVLIPDEDGGYSQGETVEETLANGEDVPIWSLSGL